MGKIPVILDTDIGFDIDDVWAVVMMLKSPELDIKLITTDTGNTLYRAKIVAKMLEIAGRTDIPIGIGIPLLQHQENHGDWVIDYDLSDFPGTVIEDGVGAIVDTIMKSTDVVSLVCIGPLPNIAAALQREPRIASKCRFIGMHGSIRRGYGGVSKPAPEFNVYQAVESCRKVFNAAWPITITPLDTCGLVSLSGGNYQRILESQDPLVQAIVKLYRIWKRNIDWPQYEELNPDERTSVLYDCVAVYLTITEDLLDIEELGISITDDGRTVVNESSKRVRCATAWKDQPAFENFLMQRLLSS
jgi:inosine-uridine nucleoside N-ribohydrolase